MLYESSSFIITPTKKTHLSFSTVATEFEIPVIFNRRKIHRPVAAIDIGSSGSLSSSRSPTTESDISTLIMEAIDELSQLSDSMRQAAALLADEDPGESSSSRRPATSLNVVALGNVVCFLSRVCI